MKAPRGVGASPSPRLRLACAVSAAVTVAAAPVQARAAAPQIEKAAFAVPQAAERDASVVSELRIPPGAGRRPAVLIVNNSPGFDGRRLTGRPVYVLAGARDDYDGADGCRRFVAALLREARRHVGLAVYPRATFAWDSRHGSAPCEASARQGKGGIVNVVADPDIARQSREFAVTWFGRHLGAQ